MDRPTLDIAAFLLLTAWIFGVAAAKGALSTVLAILFPPYAWYLIAVAVLS